MTLELEIDGDPVMRSYTISSSPSVPYSFSVTIKRVPGGRVSNWLHDTLSEGQELAVHGPVGLFNAIDAPSPKVLYLSGGVGITPVMSMARWFYDTNANVDMTFIHSARSPKDIIYHRELEMVYERITGEPSISSSRVTNCPGLKKNRIGWSAIKQKVRTSQVS